MKKQAHQNHATKTTYLQIYRRNENGIKFFIILAILLFIVGLVGLGSRFLIEESTVLDLPIWNSILSMAIGTSNFFLLTKSLRDKKYYISWNEKEINFLLPKQKAPENIRITDIKSISINNKEIKMTLKNNLQKSINLNFIFLPNRNLVKNYFEILKQEKEHENYLINEQSEK